MTGFQNFLILTCFFISQSSIAMTPLKHKTGNSHIETSPTLVESNLNSTAYNPLFKPSIPEQIDRISQSLMTLPYSHHHSRDYDAHMVVQAQQDTNDYTLQADNDSVKTDGVIVNPMTGNVGADIELFHMWQGIALDFSVSFSAQTKGNLGLPDNWRYNLPMVDNKSITYNGQTYLIDNTWSDISGYHSGLRYMNNHGVSFKLVLPNLALPAFIPHDLRRYAYLLTLKDGGKYYFDSTGKIIAQTDKFNNYIIYHYIEDTSGIPHNKLQSISNNLGQSYQFTYMPHEITITLDKTQDGQINKKSLVYTSKGIIQYIDPMGNQTTFSYIEKFGQMVLQALQKPTGEKIVFTYCALPFITDNHKIDQRPALASMQVLDISQQNKILSTTDYQYGSLTGGRNYTGYPSYNLVQKQDHLMESNDTSFKYDVMIRQLSYTKSGKMIVKKQMDTIYNALSQPLYSNTYLPTDDLQHPSLHQVYLYNTGSAQKARENNYNQPSIITDYLYSPKLNKYLPQLEKSLRYDDYGNTIESKLFLFNTKGLKKTLSLQINSTYDERYGELLYEKTQVYDSITKKYSTLELMNKLNADATNILTTLYRYSHDGNHLQSWKTMKFEYNSYGWVTKRVIAWVESSHEGIQSSNTNYQYSYNPRLNQWQHTTINAIGDKSTSTYDAATGNVLQSQDSSGAVTHYQYDLIGRLINIVTPLGMKTQYYYHVFQKDGENTQITVDETSHQKIIFDAAGRELKQFQNTDAMKPECLKLVLSCTYDQLGNRVSVTDALGNTVTKKYNRLGLLTQTTDIYGNVTQYHHDISKHQVKIYENKQFIKKIIFDVQKNPIEVTNYAFSNNKHTASSIIKEHFIRDGLGRLIQQTKTQINTDTKHVTQLESASIQYNADSKQQRITLTSKGDTVSIYNFYDLLDNKLSAIKTVTYRDGRKYHLTRDKFQYNASGVLISTIDALGHMTKYLHDSKNRSESVTSPDGTIHTKKYDADGKLLMESWQSPTGKQAYISYSYDAKGRLILLSNKIYTQIFSYYGNTRLLKSFSYNHDKQQVYYYDDYARLKALQDFTGVITHYIYNPQGQIQQINSAVGVTHYNYSNFSQKTEDDNGLFGSLLSVNYPGYTTIYSYDAFGRIAHTKKISLLGKILSDIHQEYNALNRVTLSTVDSQLSSNNALNHREQYTYDGLGQLVLVSQQDLQNQPLTKTSYTYDGNGNILFKRCNDHVSDYQYNQIDQLIHYTDNGEGYSPQYDPNGDMIYDGKDQYYSFNLMGQLATVTTSDGRSIAYDYYPDKLRATRNVDNEPQFFYYDTSKKVTAIADQNHITGFIMANNQQHLAAYKASVKDNKKSVLYYLQTDSNESTSATLQWDTHFKQSSLSLLGVQSYQPYGHLAEGDLQTDASNNFTYDGEYQDPATHLVYLQSRDYAPELQRFVSQDTLHLWNRYNFADADPVNNIDPSGHTATSVLTYMLRTALFVNSLVDTIDSFGAAAPFWVKVANATATLSNAAGIASQYAQDVNRTDTSSMLSFISTTSGFISSFATMGMTLNNNVDEDVLRQTLNVGVSALSTAAYGSALMAQIKNNQMLEQTGTILGAAALLASGFNQLRTVNRVWNLGGWQHESLQLPMVGSAMLGGASLILSGQNIAMIYNQNDPQLINAILLEKMANLGTSVALKRVHATIRDSLEEHSESRQIHSVLTGEM